MTPAFFLAIVDTSTTRLLLQRANEAQKKLKRLHTPSSSRSAAVDSSLVSVSIIVSCIIIV